MEKKKHLDELERQKLAAVNATVEQARVQGRTQAESEANLKTAQQFQELLTQSDKRNEMQSKLSLINNQTIAHSMLQGIALSTSSYFIKFIFIVVCLFDMYQLSALTAQKS